MSTQLHDTDLDLALARLVADGVVTPQQADAVGAMRDACAAERHAERATQSGRRGLIALASVGGVLIGVGVLTWLLSGWEGYSDAMQLALVWGGAVALIVTAAVVVVRNPDGVAALRSRERRGRAAGVGTLGLLAAGLAALGTAMSLQLTGATTTWTERGLTISLLCWCVASVIVLATAVVAPGPMATLPAWACSLGLSMTAAAWALPFDRSDAVQVRDVAMLLLALALGGLWAGLGPRVARPPMLAVALGVATWLFAAISAGSMWPDQFRHTEYLTECEAFDDGSCDWIQQGLAQSRVFGTIGLVALVALMVVGFTVFVRHGGWPWAAGGVIAATATTQILAQRTLGPAAAFVLAGLVLVALSLVVGLRRRGRAEPADDTGATTSTPAKVAVATPPD